jgi:hypothetical protein
MAELASQPTSVQSMYGWYAENRLFVNRRYQRKLVWTLNEKQKLIESILNKYPIPAVLIAERDVRAGSVCLNSYPGFAKWILALVMPLPGLASAH